VKKVKRREVPGAYKKKTSKKGSSWGWGTGEYVGVRRRQKAKKKKKF